MYGQRERAVPLMKKDGVPQRTKGTRGKCLRARMTAWTAAVFAIVATVATVATASPLFFSKDTLYERGFFSHSSTDEVYLVNRGDLPAKVDSLAVTLDRNVFKTLSMSFSADVSDNGRIRQERIFYWDDGTSVWLSNPLVVPPKDSVRIHSMTVDQCPRCSGRRAPSETSGEIVAPVNFRSNRGGAKVIMTGWYYLL